MQGPGGGITAGDAITPAPAATAQATFPHHQAQHDHQRDQSQADGGGGITVRLPGVQDAGRQAGDPQQLHSPQLVDDLHSHQGHTGTDRGHGDGQRHAPEGGPGTNAHAAAGLQLASAAHAKTFRAQQKHVGVGGEGHHGDAPAQTMNAPTGAAAQIHQGGGQQISGGCQGDQLGDAQPAPSRKTAVDQQPSVGGADHRAPQGTAQKQQESSADLTSAIRPKLHEPLLQTLQPLTQQLQQRPKGQQCQSRGQQRQQATAHCQPLAAISSSACAFSSPRRSADTLAWLKCPQAWSTGSSPIPLSGYSWFAAA